MEFLKPDGVPFPCKKMFFRRGKGIDVLGVVCHVSNREQRRDLIQKTVNKYGGIDILVSNAAANPIVDPIVEISELVLDKLWEINVKATVLLVQDAAAHLSQESSIITRVSNKTISKEKGLLRGLV